MICGFLLRRKLAVCLSLSVSSALMLTVASLAAENKDRDTAIEKMRESDFDAALNCLDRAVGASRTDPENFMLRGRCLFRLSNYELAIADFNMVLNLSPNYFSAYLWRGSAHAKLGADDLAIKDYEQAIRLNPRLAHRFFQPSGMKVKGQSEAVKAAERFRLPGVSPENINSNAAKDYKEAMRRVYPDGLAKGAAEKTGKGDSATYATDADDQTYLTDMASGAEKESNSDRSASADSSAKNDSGISDESLDPKKNKRVVNRMDQDPNYAEFGKVAGSQPLNGDAETVIKRCTEALRMDESNAEYYYLRAKAYQKLAKVDKAYDDYCQAIRLGQAVSKYYIGRASLFYQLNKPLLVDADVKSAQSMDRDLPHKIHFGGTLYPSSVKWSGDGPGGQ